MRFQEESKQEKSPSQNTYLIDQSKVLNVIVVGKYLNFIASEAGQGDSLLGLSSCELFFQFPGNEKK